MTDDDAFSSVAELVNGYAERIEAELAARWQAWPLDLSRTEMYEVLGALMARQVTLAIQLAAAPTIWNGHVAPVILRAMTDVYITFAWIWQEPLDRSRQFVLYGLGQEKLHIEHLKAEVERRGGDPATDPMVQGLVTWLNAQRYTFLTEVNVGSWSGVDTRTMADQAGCIDLYRFAYAPFSQATHSTWSHLLKYNLVHCTNPLHRFHRVPGEADCGIDVDYLYQAAKYVRKTFDLFDEGTGVTVNAESGYAFVVDGIERLSSIVSHELPEGEGVASSEAGT